VNCEQARGELSAQLDGEPAGHDAAALAEHLSRCQDCRRWQEDAHTLTRLARLGEARDTAHLLPALLEDYDAYALRRRRGWVRRPEIRRAVARALLVAVGMAQVVLGSPLLLGEHHHPAPEHLTRELGSLTVALAAGFVLAAWRPVWAYGMSPLVGCVVVFLVATAALDLESGHTHLAQEISHALVALGFVLLAWLARLTGGGTSRPAGPRRPLAGPTPSTVAPLRSSGTGPVVYPGWPGGAARVPPPAATSADVAAAPEHGGEMVG
jgi:predicted anti-sigma-YlaC factor YlaD